MAENKKSQSRLKWMSHYCKYSSNDNGRASKYQISSYLFPCSSIHSLANFCASASFHRDNIVKASVEFVRDVAVHLNEIKGATKGKELNVSLISIKNSSV